MGNGFAPADPTPESATQAAKAMPMRVTNASPRQSRGFRCVSPSKGPKRFARRCSRRRNRTRSSACEFRRDAPRTATRTTCTIASSYASRSPPALRSQSPPNKTAPRRRSDSPLVMLERLTDGSPSDTPGIVKLRMPPRQSRGVSR